jgi:hypothetical protein
VISAAGSISLIAPAVCPADHYRRVRRAKAEVTVERRSPNLPAQLGIGAVKRAMLAIEVHRHPAVTAILDVRGIDGGLDLVAADRERESVVGGL